MKLQQEQRFLINTQEFSLSLCSYLAGGKENCQASLKLALEAMLNLPVNHPLEISNHYNLKDHPSIAVSLSHTQNIGAALLASIDKFPSVGVDIELRDRLITPGAQKYFLNETDSVGKDFLMIWTQKEAAFKALSPVIGQFDFKEVLLLKHIWLRGDSFGLINNSNALGKILTLEGTLEEKKLVISLAFLTVSIE